MDVNATKLPPFGGLFGLHWGHVSCASLIDLHQNLWTQEKITMASLFSRHAACPLHQTPLSSQFFDWNCGTHKTSKKRHVFAKQKTIVASILSTTNPTAAPGSWKHDMMKLYLKWEAVGVMKLMVWLPHLSSKKRGVGFQTLITFSQQFPNIREQIKRFSGWNPYLATSTGSWILNFSPKDVPKFFSADVKAMISNQLMRSNKNTVESGVKSRVKSDEIWKLLFEVKIGDWAYPWNFEKMLVGSMSHLPSWSSKSLTRKQQLPHQPLLKSQKHDL